MTPKMLGAGAGGWIWTKQGDNTRKESKGLSQRSCIRHHEGNCSMGCELQKDQARPRVSRISESIW